MVSAVVAAAATAVLESDKRMKALIAVSPGGGNNVERSINRLHDSRAPGEHPTPPQQNQDRVAHSIEQAALPRSHPHTACNREQARSDHAHDCERLLTLHCKTDRFHATRLQQIGPRHRSETALPRSALPPYRQNRSEHLLDRCVGPRVQKDTSPSAHSSKLRDPHSQTARWERH